ncbi:MAG: ATP-binding protein [Betaproteobacteria bacterium]
MPIRSRLIALSIAILLPVIVAAGFGLAMLYKDQEEQAQNDLREITRALAAVVERELAVIETTLRTLATSPYLTEGNLKAFYQYARAIVPSPERTIVLIDKSGQQLVNTRRAYGEPLPKSRAFGEEALNRGIERVLSDVYFAPIGQQYSYAIRIAVERNGELLYYLSMVSYGATLQKVLDDQRLRPGWNAAILDGKGVLLARRLEPQNYVGKPGTDRMLSEMKRAPEGLFRSTRLDGVESFAFHTRIPGTEWTFVTSMPQSELRATLIGALQFTGATALAGLALALLMAYFASRTIADEVSELTRLAAELGKGRKIDVPHTGITEIQQVAVEMARASERIRSAKVELEARVSQAVTESGKAHEAMLQHQKLEALGRLTGGIAHDFNNLLQTISMSIELAARSAKEPAVVNALDAGKRAAQNAAKLTRQLMSFGRNRVGEVVTVDFRDRLLQTKDLIGNALRADVRLHIEAAGDLWPITVDTVQLELSLLNAALNARDAMPKGGALTISAVNEVVQAGQIAGLAPGEYVRIAIHDTGEGIAPEVLPRVFEPFFTTKETGKGSGLGLAQIYGFAKQFGGIAEIRSAAGRGTTVSMLLPRAGAPAAEQPAPAPPARPARRYEVLFVEDDPLVQQVVVPALRASGFGVVPAASVEEALAVAAQRKIDAVFTDIVMPGGSDGMDLAMELKRRFPAMPVILATGYTQELPHAPGLRILLKPYKLEDAEALLIEELERARTASA